jgi:hypothetical protein
VKDEENKSVRAFQPAKIVLFKALQDKKSPGDFSPGPVEVVKLRF